jgi:hypothetical protein
VGEFEKHPQRVMPIPWLFLVVSRHTPLGPRHGLPYKENNVNKDPVIADLDRYLDSLEEDFVDDFDRKRERDEYLADQEDPSEE